MTINIAGEEIEKPYAGSPNIRIDLDQEMVQVNVEPGNDGIGRFTGTVYCEMPASTPPGQYCYVQLTADAGGWPCSNPEVMTFDRNHEEEDFALSIQVPIETSQSTHGQLSVSGRWSYSPGALGGTIPPATAIIKVMPYSKPIVSTESRNNTIKVGKWGDIVIKVTNGGNANDEMQLEVSGIPDGVDAYFEDDSILVPEKQSNTAILRVKQSNGAPKTHQMVVIAKGRNNGTKNQDQQTVVFETGISAKSLITTPYIVIPFVIILIVGGVITFKVVRKKKKRKIMVKEIT
jgi:hypothetical protein